MWLGSIRPRSQCVGGMLPVQWCYKHVLGLSKQSGAAASLLNQSALHAAAPLQRQATCRWQVQGRVAWAVQEHVYDTTVPATCLSHTGFAGVWTPATHAEFTNGTGPYINTALSVRLGLIPHRHGAMEIMKPCLIYHDVISLVALVCLAGVCH